MTSFYHTITLFINFYFFFILTFNFFLIYAGTESTETKKPETKENNDTSEIELTINKERTNQQDRNGLFLDVDFQGARALYENPVNPKSTEEGYQLCTGKYSKATQEQCSCNSR